MLREKAEADAGDESDYRASMGFMKRFMKRFVKRKPHEGTQERRVERAIGFDARRAASAGLGRETRNVGDAAGVRAGVGANAQERRVEKALGFLPAWGARRR